MDYKISRDLKKWRKLIKGRRLDRYCNHGFQTRDQGLDSDKRKPLGSGHIKILKPSLQRFYFRNRSLQKVETL